MATGNPYVPVTITGYNVTPPTDDGAQTAANTVEWAKHETKLSGPVKTGVDSTQTAIIAALDQRLLNSIDGKTGAYTVLTTDRGKILNFTGGAPATFTLLASATAKVGFELVIRNSGTAVLTVDGNAAETVDGVASVDLFPGQKIWLQCDGTNWVVASDSLRPGVIAKTNTDSPYTVLVDDNGRVIDVDASGGAVTINLPAAATAKNGFSVIVKKTDSSANAVTADADGTETIDGALTAVLSDQYQSTQLFCDGSEWFVSGVPSVPSIETIGPTVTTTGTQVDVSGIPSDAKVVHAIIDNISLTSTTGILALQLGDSGGIEATGYEGSNTSGGIRFNISTNISAAERYDGVATFRLSDSSTNTWIMTSQMISRVGGTVVKNQEAGRKQLTTALTQLRILATADAFDLGQITLQIET